MATVSKVDSTNGALSVGIKFYLEGDTANDWVQIPGIQSPGSVGDKGTFKDATAVDEEGYTYIAAVPEGEDRELTFLYYPDNSAQETLRTTAAESKTKKVKIEFTRLKKAGVFEMVFAGWAMAEPEFNEAAKFVVYGKKNTSVKTAWSAIV